MSTVKIAGCWDERMLPTSAIEYNSRWKFLVIGFQLNEIYMTPVTGFDKVTELENLMNAVSINPELVPVLVDECSSNTLQQFQHPKDALYLFGRTGHSIFGGWKGKSVGIEYPGELSSYLQPDQAAAIVLYDRMMKS